MTRVQQTPSPKASSLADVLAGAVPLTLRYVAGFDDVTALQQFSGRPNHVIWTLGHCGWTAARVASHLSSKPVSAAWYSQEPGCNAAFQIASICRGSTPSVLPGTYPTLERALEIFRTAHGLLASVVLSLDDERFCVETEWHDGPIRLDALLSRVAFHTACHAGQIIDLRRAIGLPLVLAPSSSQ